MKTQEQNGGAYEYACIFMLHQLLVNNNNVVHLNSDDNFVRAKKYYDGLPLSEQNMMLCSARKGILHIANDLEPMIFGPLNETIELSLQSDQKGGQGDIRDLITLRSQSGWEVGVSIKHNSVSIRSLRLSRKNDFFQKMGAISSPTYKSAIDTAFSYVDDNVGKIWKNQGTDKETKHYVPLLSALADEMRIQMKESDFAKKLLFLVLGTTDSYKLSLKKSGKKTSTTVEAFNMKGTLNQPYNGLVSKHQVPIFSVPQKVDGVVFKTKKKKNALKDTLLISFDNGLELSFRIHNDDAEIGATNPKLEWGISKYPPAYYIRNVP